MRMIYSALCILLIYAISTVTTGGSAAAQEQNPVKQPLANAQIVGGGEAQPGEWPWQVIIFPGPFMCGGSLIHPEWVMTAAHCVHDERGNLMSPQNISAVLGEHDLSVASGNEQNRAISQIIPHPNYLSQTADNDIALLRLSTPASLNAAVSTIPLITSPNDDGLVAASSVAWVTGWGATEEGRGTTNILREVDVLFVADKSCNLAYGGDITENMICAGYAEGGKDACQGDSGGPLVVQSSSGWRQAGIVSWGYGCARPDKYGVYTRVSRYTPWIAQQTGISIDPTATPMPTPTPMATSTPTPGIETPIPSPTPTATATATAAVPQEILRNGAFERGSNSDWTEDSSTLGTSGGSIIYPASALAIAPRSGQYGAWLGGLSPEVSDLAQSVTLPANSRITVHFYYQIRSAETDCTRDVAYVRVNSNPVSSFELCSTGKTSDWVADSVDLSDYAGQTVTVGFRLQNDESRVSSLFIDDVEIDAGSAAPVSTATTLPSDQPTTMPSTPIGTPSTSAVQNGDFESGANGSWLEESANFGGQGEIILSNIDLPDKIPAQSGLYAAWLGGAHNENSTLRQEITVPSGAPTLTYFTRISSNDVCGYDRGTVSINNNVVVTYELCRNSSKGEWAQQSVPLQKYAGQRVLLEFGTVTDGSLVSSFFVDNVSVDTTVPTPEATETAIPHETIALIAESGATGIRTSWSAAVDPRVASYRILRRFTQEFTEIATTSTTIYQDLDSSNNDLATSARYCYQIEALTQALTVVATSNVACATHGQLSLWIPDVVGAPTSEVRVPINVVNAYNLRIRNAEVWIDYDPNVLEISGVAKSILAQGYEWSYTIEESGAALQRVRISGVPQGSENPQPIYGDGPLFAVHFKIIGINGNKSPLLLRHTINVTGGSTIDILTNSEGETQEEATIPLDLQDGFLAVQSAPQHGQGDSDGNGTVNQADVVQMLRYAVAEEKPSDKILSATDLNGNRTIEAADAAMLAYYLENKQWPVLPSETASPEPTNGPTATPTAPLEPTATITSIPTSIPTAQPTESAVPTPTETPSGTTTIPNPRRATTASRLVTSIGLTDAEFAPGTIATVAIVANNVHEFAGGDITIVYDPTIFTQILTVTPGEEVRDFTLEYADNGKGKLTISLAGKKAINGDVTLANFTTQLATSPPASDDPVDLASVKLADSYGRDFITSFPGNALELIDARTVVGSNRNEVYLPAVMK